MSIAPSLLVPGAALDGLPRFAQDERGAGSIGVERYHRPDLCHSRRVISGIIFVIKNGLRWRDAPAECRPSKTIYNRLTRWSRPGLFKDLRRPFSQIWQTRPADDRGDPSEGAPDRSQSAHPAQA